MESTLNHGTGSHEPLPNATARQMLARSFTSGQLAYLYDVPEFQLSVAAIVTLDAYEKATTLGHRLLAERIHPGE